MKKKARINRWGEIHRYCRCPTMGRFLSGDHSWRAIPRKAAKFSPCSVQNLAARQRNRSDVV